MLVNGTAGLRRLSRQVGRPELALIRGENDSWRYRDRDVVAGEGRRLALGLFVRLEVLGNLSAGAAVGDVYFGDGAASAFCEAADRPGAERAVVVGDDAAEDLRGHNLVENVEVDQLELREGLIVSLRPAVVPLLFGGQVVARRRGALLFR